MSIVTRIMQHPHSEVLLTFMYEETIRFLTPQSILKTQYWADTCLHVIYIGIRFFFTSSLLFVSLQ